MRGPALCVLFGIAGCGGSTNPATPDGPGGSDGSGGSDAPGDGSSPDSEIVPPDPCAPGTWCTEDSPVAGILLRAVWAAGLNDVFAVGDNGTILHRRNNVWTAMTTPTAQNLRGVWGVSATDVWAAGDNGALLHFDGAAWTAQGSFTADLTGVWASSTDDVWIAAGGSAIHWTGSTFESFALPGTVFAISGTGANDVWATGENAKVDHFTTAWTTGIDPGAGNTYFAILALPGETWVSSFAPNKETLRFAGNTWVPHDTNGTTFQAFYPIASDNLWGAGGADVGHWSGQSWTIESPAGNTVQLFGVGGIGESLWVVGSGATILHRR